MRRRNVEFPAADGTTLRGWFYPAARVGKPGPTIVMAHGYGSLKEMYLDRYADAFAASGLASFVYDHRNFGASDGYPRQEIDPWVQIRDYRDAITYASMLEEVDGSRIGVWGSSYSGGHCIVVAALDRRVRAVSIQVPLVAGLANFRCLVRADQIAKFRAQFDADRIARFRGETPGTIQIVTDQPGTTAAFPTDDSFEYYTTAGKLAPQFRNYVTLRSVEMLSEYEPGVYISAISPTPFQMIVGDTDHLTPVHLALSAYETANEPKNLIVLPGGHFSVYTETFPETSSAAIVWYQRYL